MTETVTVFPEHSVEVVPVDHSRNWANIPAEILEIIYKYLPTSSRKHASCVCHHWRQCLFSHQLWKQIKVELKSRQDSCDLHFIRSFVHLAKVVHIHWPLPEGTNTRGKGKDAAQKKRQIIYFFRALEDCTRLHELIIRLEHSEAFNKDFAAPIMKSLTVVLPHNPYLTILSFGCNGLIVPVRCMALLHDSSRRNMQQLHVASVDLFEENNYFDMEDDHNSTRLSPFSNVPVSYFSQFHHLTNLSMDWACLSAEVLQGLNARDSSTVPLNKLSLYVKEHDCYSRGIYHPLDDEWQTFAARNPDVCINLVFVQKVVGACDALGLIKPGISLVKILECTEIDPQEFGKAVIPHKDTIQGLIHVGTWDSIELESGPELWQYVSLFTNIKYLSFIGHFILDTVFLFLVSHFMPTTFVVSKPHVLTLAEATEYLLPLSPSQYRTFRENVSTVLGKPWEALPKVPFEGFYFSEGKDDTLYYNGYTELK